MNFILSFLWVLFFSQHFSSLKYFLIFTRIPLLLDTLYTLQE